MDLSQKQYNEIFTYYQKADYDKIEKVIVFGDIHGDLNAFKSCLKKAHLINLQDRWIGGDTHVVQVGDVLDRKPRNDNYSDEDSEFILISFILKLQIESYLCGGGYHPIIGNHELMNIMGVFDYVSNMGMRHFNTFNERKEYFKLGSNFCKYLACGWNPVIRINNCLICHGGISKTIASKYTIKEINKIMRKKLYNEGSFVDDKLFHDLFINENSILWSRTYSNADHETPRIYNDVKFVLNKFNCRFMILGHTPYIEGIKIKYSGHVICTDTAMSTAFGSKKGKFDRIHFVEIIKNKILIK